jgi:tRNA(fMet)-specific endonuclease VapC
MINRDFPERYLLDTNALIDLLNGHSALESVLLEHGAVTSIIAIGELFFGAEKSRRAADNKAKIEDVLKHIDILYCDLDTARIYGQVVNSLQQQGTPIPQNDCWIAALALQHRLILMTRDAHFRHIKLLQTANW